MKKKMNQRKRIIIGMLVALVAMLGLGKVEAVSLQANPNTQIGATGKQYRKVLAGENGWIELVRQMEYPNEAMGLQEEKGENLLGKTQNGIDVHCAKTTEWGAMAILSASGYGNPSNDNKITTTTGNNTGVMFYISAEGNDEKELTAGGLAEVVTGVDGRYYDTYTVEESSAKRGDALADSSAINFGCKGWHGAGKKGWVSTEGTNNVFVRRFGGMFGYASYSSTDSKYNARAVAVCHDEL